jgi:hypothetical protein
MGVLSGVVPPQRWLPRLAPVLKMEIGLIVGLLLVAAGLGWSVALVLNWGAGGFGALDPTQTMRQAIPAVTLMILGIQGACGALFAGALHSCWRSPNRNLA